MGKTPDDRGRLRPHPRYPSISHWNQWRPPRPDLRRSGGSQPSLPDLGLLESQTRLVVRKSPKLTPDGFLQSLLSAVGLGQGSFNQLVGLLNDLVDSPMARQSLHERLGPESTAFLLAVLSDLMEVSQATVRQLVAVYRARWAVEIQFRAWTQSLNLDKSLNRRSNEHHMQALVLAGMIAHQLGMRIAARLGQLVASGRLSYERLYDPLASHMVRARNLAETDAFTPEWRHVKRDERKRQSPVESGIQALA